MSITDDAKELYDYQIGSEYVLSKITELEDISRCSNERIDGIARKKVKLGMNARKKLKGYCWPNLT